MHQRRSHSEVRRQCRVSLFRRLHQGTLCSVGCITFKLRMYTVEPLTPQNQDRWDVVIQQCPNTTAFQSLAWRDALANAFRQLTPVYMFIKQQGSVIGGLPAFIFQPIPGIRLWHSMPWNLSGGIHLRESVHLNPEILITSVETAAVEKGWCEIGWTLPPEHTTTYGDAFTKSGYERTNHFTHPFENEWRC